MKLKILYRKNLKMSVGKIAAQACHAAIGFNVDDPLISVVVLGCSDRQFQKTISSLDLKNESYYIVYDAGYTEVRPNTQTALCFMEKD
jgi:peptidyl-tRNA hydrolase